MKTRWKSWVYLKDRHIFVHELGFVVGDTFLADIYPGKDTDKDIQNHLNHLEFILKEEKRTV
jgi:hypothetical protein